MDIYLTLTLARTRADFYTVSLCRNILKEIRAGLILNLKNGEHSWRLNQDQSR